MQAAKPDVGSDLQNVLAEIPKASKNICWMCLRTILPEEKSDKHHVIPRYLCRAILKYQAIKVKVHVFCHRIWHWLIDKPVPTWREYVVNMKPIQYGYGYFAKHAVKLLGVA